MVQQSQRMIASCCFVCLICVTEPDKSHSAPPATGPASTAPNEGNVGWGTAVGGIAIRLVADNHVIREGEILSLKLEFQNVGAELIRIDGPSLLPIISALNDHPFESPIGINTVIVAEPTSGKQIFIRWARQELPNEVRMTRLLAPGGRFTLHISAIRVAATNVKVEDAVEGATAEFAYRGVPGKYQLTASYNVAQGPEGGAWAGCVTTGALEIEVLPASNSRPTTRADRREDSR